MSDLILNNQVAFFYSLVGIAFLGMTLEPALRHRLTFNIPVIYILVGAAASFMGLPFINPLRSDEELKLVEHVSELIVIVSLTGAGLAIDLRMGWKKWQPTWRLLIITMPITMLVAAMFGLHLFELSLAASILIAASLAPTDPVLARSVSVGGPNTQQDGTKIALTTEAGLNDGLAFPFVWLAIGIAASGANFSITQWFSWDVLYRISMGVIIGIACGIAITKLLFSRIGDATNERRHTALFVLATTFIAYGVAEFLHGYGFLAVFIAARASRALTRRTDAEPYENAAHRSADQLETILLAVVLLWFGTFIGGEIWKNWSITDLLFAMTIVLFVRPLAGWIALLGYDCSFSNRLKISFFGIRGMGTIFYVAFGLSHADFANSEQIWSIISLTIIVSAIIHGSLSSRWIAEESQSQSDNKREHLSHKSK